MGDIFLSILGWVDTLLFQVLITVLLIPLGCVVWTPVAPVQSCFGDCRYGEKLKARYAKLIVFLVSMMPDRFED